MSMSFMFPEMLTTSSGSVVNNEPQGSKEPRAILKRSYSSGPGSGPRQAKLAKSVFYKNFSAKQQPSSIGTEDSQIDTMCSDKKPSQAQCGGVKHAKCPEEREILKCGGKTTEAPESQSEKKRLLPRNGPKDQVDKMDPESDAACLESLALEIERFSRRSKDRTLTPLERSKARAELVHLRKAAGKFESHLAEPPVVQTADVVVTPGSGLARKRAAQAEAAQVRWIKNRDHWKATTKAAHRSAGEACDHAGIALQTQFVVRERFAEELQILAEKRTAEQ